MTATPESLLHRLRQPFEPEAWERFVSLYTSVIYSWGVQVGLQDEDAADLVQEVFVSLVQILPTFTYDRHRSFRRWLRSVTLNKWRNRRKQFDEKLFRTRDGDVDWLAGPDDLEAAWEAEYKQCLAAQALRIMRGDFQEKTWKACWQMVVDNRSAEEVAKALDLTVGAVYAAKFRVLDRLRRELHGMLE